MKAMKFKVESPEHSRQIQERLFEMGYEWLMVNVPNKTVSFLNKPFIFAENGQLKFYADNDYFNSSPHQLTTLQDILPWQPKQGEMIEVSDDGIEWRGRVFIAKYKDKFVFETPHGDVCVWKHARPINTIHREIDELKARIKELEGRL